MRRRGHATNTGAGPPADLPAECATTSIELTIPAVPEYTGPFEVESAVGVATPIVPNGDGSLDDLDPAEFEELGAETDLVFFTQWIGDHEFGPDDIGSFSGPEAPEGSVALGLTVVPTVSTGLQAGDVVASTDEFEYDSITTFGSVGLFFDPAEGIDTYFMVNLLDDAQGGTAEVLYLHDGWLCVNWKLAGETREPEGTYSLAGTVVTPFERAVTPFT